METHSNIVKAIGVVTIFAAGYGTKGILKELTGGDSMYVRGNYKEGHEVKPDMKTFLQCNHAPKAPTYDRAFYNRLRMILFGSEFTAKAPVDEEEQIKQAKFPADPSFRRWLPYLAPAFATMLYHQYIKYAREGLIAPDEVLSRTNKYRKSNDTLMEFIDQNIQEDRDETRITKCASLKEIYAIHKTWFKDNFPGCKIPEMLDFKEDLIERWGEPMIYKGQPRWMGIKLRNDDIPEKETPRKSRIEKKAAAAKKTEETKSDTIKKEKTKRVKKQKHIPEEKRRRSSRLSGKGG